MGEQPKREVCDIKIQVEVSIERKQGLERKSS